jgi:hypothetical protein
MKARNTALRSIALTPPLRAATADPIKAIGAYLRYREFDEIIVSTLPRGISRWPHQDLPHRIERKFHLPVAVITAQH